MVTPLLDRLRARLAAYRIFTPGDTLVVAVSGGPDSLCLLHGLYSLRDEFGLRLHVVHLDHMLRGAESAAEAAFVGALAQRWGLAHTIAAVDVATQAQTTHDNLHQAGRIARYKLLAEVAHEQQARAVAVAHHANDQAETVLMHLLRGAGPAGLGGMRPLVPWGEWSTLAGRHFEPNATDTRPVLIRPLLDVGRDEIEAYCAAHQLEPRRDPSNFDQQPTRNRIRLELIPRLIEYNPHIITALGRTAHISADEHDLVLQVLDAIWPTLTRLRPGAVDFVGEVWRAQHPAIQREAIRRAYVLLGRGETLEYEQIEAVRALVERGVGRQTMLPGRLPVLVGYGGAFSIGAPPEPDGPQLPVAQLALPIPGRVALGQGWQLVARITDTRETDDTAWSVYLDADAIAEPLFLRRRRAGDRVRLIGGRGSRRLQDLFVDAKIARVLRDAWPLVATTREIAWVPGVRPLVPYRATPESKRLIHLSIEQGTITE